MGGQLVASPNIVPIDIMPSQNHNALDQLIMQPSTMEVGLTSFWLFIQLFIT